MMQWHYTDLVSGQLVVSNVEILSNGVQLIGKFSLPDMEHDPLEMEYLAANAQRRETGAVTQEKMWRYYNNARVARKYLDGSLSAAATELFGDMLAENKLGDSAFYGSMTLEDFSMWVIGLDDEFELLGLRLETDRIRQRRLLELT